MRGAARLEIPIDQIALTTANKRNLKVVVTGSNGFVGRALTPVLAKSGVFTRRWQSRDPLFDLSTANEQSRAKWIEALRDVDVVVHLAAHVHQLQPERNADASLPMRINCNGTLQLAEAALAAGVKRFLFISTAKVFGEGERGPYRSDSVAAPQDAYALSKWEAEQGLRQITFGKGMELVIIRPPLVYGPTAGANFARLKQLADIPLPLPIGAVCNRRDMIGIDNLIDLIVLCIHSPAAAGGTWLCSDGAAYSLADVVRTLRRARGMPELLFSVPAAWVVRCAEFILGSAASQRLFGNFELDISATCAQLRWSPPYSMLTIMQKEKESR